MKNTSHTKERGYSILEVLIAISVIITGIFGVMSLVVKSMSSTRTALDYLVAANLAREGIELVRNQRDTNWYSANNFDDGLTDAVFYTAVIDYNDASFTFIADDIDAAACELHRQGSVYTRDMGNPTGYYRLIYFNNICQDLSVDPIVPANESVKTAGADCDLGYTKIGIDVISRVKWQDPSTGPKTVDLNDRFYNWR